MNKATPPPHDPLVARAPPSARQVAGVVAGNALEFYDFLTYSFFAVQIGQTFFPSDNPTTSLLASLATFGAGFLTRPVGALVIGRLADRVGRKPAMLLTFALMGLAIVGLALTPSYARLGVAAPILAIAFRLIQGFALGGQVGPSTAFLVEAAPPGRRGLYVSLQYMSQDGAILCAGLMGVGLSSVMDAQAMRDWGWRIAFLVGALIVPFGLILRRGLTETLHHGPAGGRDEADAALGGSGTAQSYRVIAILGLIMLASGTVVSYLLSYLTTYASATLHMPARVAFGATVVLGLTGVCFDVVGGWLADRFGRKPVMMAPWALLLVTTLPLFYAVAHYRSAVALFGATALLQVMSCITSSAVLVAVTEALPRRLRSGTLAVVYALAMSVFGGTAQFNVTWLTAATHNPLAPAWYMTVAVAIGLLAMLGLRETAPRVTEGSISASLALRPNA